MTITMRMAEPADAAGLVELRALMFDAMGRAAADTRDWRENARRWFERNLTSGDAATFVAETRDGELASAALGTIERSVPSPGNPDGIRGHVSNVVTRPLWRRSGLARGCVERLLRWFEQHSTAATVDLLATGDGADLYREFGFHQRPYPALRLELPRSPTAIDP